MMVVMVAMVVMVMMMWFHASWDKKTIFSDIRSYSFFQLYQKWEPNTSPAQVISVRGTKNGRAPTYLTGALFEEISPTLPPGIHGFSLLLLNR